MARFDRTLVEPTQEELLYVLERAHPLLPALAEAVLEHSMKIAEGWHEWDNPTLGAVSPLHRTFVVIAWWTDHIGRKHYRIVGQRSGLVSPPPPNNFLCPHGEPRPPLWLVYPNFTFLRCRGKRRDLVALCRCGTVGTPPELAWMGDCCGPCHDRRESGIDPPRLCEKTTFAVSQDGTSGNGFLTLSPDGRLLAAGTGQGPLRAWDIETGREFVTPAESWTCAAFAPDGRTLTAARSGSDAGLHQFDLPTLQRRSTLSVLEWGDQLVYSPDGAFIGGLVGRRLRLLDVTTGRIRPGSRGVGSRVTSCLAFAPDSRTVAGGVPFGTIVLADVGTGQERTLHLPHLLVTSLAFSPDGGTLATGTIGMEEDGFPLADRGRVYLWNLARSTVHTTLPGHTHGTTAVAYSPDGSVLASSGCDRMVRLWDVRSGRERCALEWHIVDVHELCFSADGSWLASLSEDGVIRLWPWRQLLEC